MNPCRDCIESFIIATPYAMPAPACPTAGHYGVVAGHSGCYKCGGTGWKQKYGKKPKPCKKCNLNRNNF